MATLISKLPLASSLTIGDYMVVDQIDPTTPSGFRTRRAAISLIPSFTPLSFNVGLPLSYAPTGLIGSYVNNIAGYSQFTVQNKSSASVASANIRVANDLATDTTNFGELGINSSAFTGSGSLSRPGNVYLMSQSSDLVLGTVGAKAIRFVTNSSNTDAGSVSSGGVWSFGQSLSYTGTNLIGSFVSTAAGPVQVTVQNKSSDPAATTQIRVANDVGTDSANFGMLSVNSSGAAGTGSLNQPSNVCLTAKTTDLVIGTQSAKSIRFVANSGATDAGNLSAAGVWNFVGVPVTVTSIAALKSQLKTQLSTTVFVLGYYTIGDGGGGPYYYDSTDTTSTDNGGTVIVAADGGRWKLIVINTVSVKQFGATGDGVTNDTTALQSATTWAKLIGKQVYFPATPAGFYKITSPINAGSSSHWFGENGASTIIRNTAGGGAPVITLDSFGGLGPYVFEHLRIGGAGCIGITATPTSFTGTISGTALTVNSGLVGGIEIGGTVTGAGVTSTGIVSGAGNSWVVGISQTVGPVTMTMTNQYAVLLTMRHVHFESDLLTGLDANCIFANWQDCSFGYYTQTATNVNFTCFKSNGNGTLNTNLNSVERARFNNSTSIYAVQITSGLLWRFKDCDWEGNVRNLTANNITGLVIDNAYTERVQTATGQAFDFGISRTRVKVLGGQFNGGSLVSGVSMFGATDTAGLLVEDADISTSTGGFAYINTTTISHTPPVAGQHHFKDCRIAGNAADPLLFLDGIIEDGVNTFTPTPTGLTVVNGTGGAGYAGTWSIRNRMVTVTIRVVTTGTCTTASTAGTTYFALPATLPSPQVTATGGLHNESTQVSLGVGLAYINGRFFVPVWTAQTGNIAMSVTYPI